MSLIKVNNRGQKDNLGRRNLIINGAMQIAQRGTSSTASGIQTVDRWKVQRSGDVTQSQEDLSSSDTPYSYGFRKALKLLNTSNANAGDTYAQIFQIIEAQNVASSGWNYTSSSSYITVQFWVKSSLAGTYSGFLRSNDGTQKGYSFDFVLVADTWKHVTVTVPGDSGLTFNHDSGNGLDLFIVPYYGTDLTTSGHTDEAWQTYSGSDITGDYAQNWKNTSNATFFVTGAQIEVNDTSTPFEHLSFGEDLSLCHRYTFALQGTGDPLGSKGGAAIVSGSRGFWGFGSAHNSANPVVWMEMPTAMRGAPSLTVSDNGHFDFDRGWAALRTSTSTVVQTLRGSSKTMAIIMNVVSGLSNGDAGNMSANNSAAYMIFDSEI